jgi:small subunit ribosomal protein S13
MQDECKAKGKARKSKSIVIRIAGYRLPSRKRVDVGLTCVFGVGRSTAEEILVEAGVDFGTRCHHLTNQQVKKVRAAVDSRCVGGDLERRVSRNIKRLIEIKSWRGRCHRRGLPVRGQRTKTNACTRKSQPKL